MKTSLKAFVLGAGIIPLGLALLGRYTPLGDYHSAPPRSWEMFSPELVRRSRSLLELYHEVEAQAPGRLDSLPPDQAMQQLYTAVCRRFTHGAYTQHNLFSNWLLVLLPRNRWSSVYITDPDSILRYGHSALCNQVAFLLMCLSEMAGIDTRVVVLQGHVVMEARYDGGWHAYDPDLEITLHDASGGVASVEWMKNNPSQVQRAYALHGGEDHGRRVAEIFRGPALYREYPKRPGAIPPLISGRLESFSLQAIFMGPMLVILASSFAFFSSRKRA